MKIKNLLVKAGCNPELVDSIVESLETYKASVRDEFEADFKARIEQAKKVCLEETEAYKRTLAKRVQTFCETKTAAVEASVAKQSALNESEAASKLRQLSNMLSGYAMNGADNGQITAALGKEKRRSQQLSEEKSKAIEVANRQTEIAKKALKENRRLATELANAKKQIAEGVVPQRNSTRIDESRKPASTPRTHRPTLLENQDRRAKPAQPTALNKRTGISAIAETMDTDLI
jgi:hypothetical protein